MKTNSYNDLTLRGGFFSPFFDDFFFPTSRAFKEAEQVMRTDVEETETGYLLSMEVAGYKKEEIGIEMKNGYLTVSATRCDTPENEENGKKYIRRERTCSSLKRSFYIGEEITENDIEASLEDGVLKIGVKKPEKKLPEAKKIFIK